MHRHEALRTTFEAAGVPQGAVQRVHAVMEVPLERTNLTDHTGTERWTEALRVANAGMVNPEMVSALVKSSWLTSGTT